MSRVNKLTEAEKAACMYESYVWLRLDSQAIKFAKETYDIVVDALALNSFREDLQDKLNSDEVLCLNVPSILLECEGYPNRKWLVYKLFKLLRVHLKHRCSSLTCNSPRGQAACNGALFHANKHKLGLTFDMVRRARDEAFEIFSFRRQKRKRPVVQAAEEGLESLSSKDKEDDEDSDEDDEDADEDGADDANDSE